MKVHAVILGTLTLSATLGLVAAQDRPAQRPDAVRPAGGPVAASPERGDDLRAIGDLRAASVKAYNEKDAKALAALFTPDAEIEDENGEVTRGRDSIMERFSGLLAGAESGTLSLTANSLRFLGANVAIEEGAVSISTRADAPPSTNSYSVIYARQGDRWFHARIRDEPSHEISPHDKLMELEWMLGDWVNESDDDIVFTTCKWSDDGNFLLRQFDVTVHGRISLSGSQRIGWDAQRKHFRMWVFDTKGGFAEGFMSRDGDRWVIKGTGARANGQSVSVTSVITVLGKDRLRWQMSDRTLDGVAVPGTDEFYMVRRAPLPGK